MIIKVLKKGPNMDLRNQSSLFDDVRLHVASRLSISAKSLFLHYPFKAETRGSH